MSLKHQDLKGTILPVISIDEFEPKTGSVEQIIVIAFYISDLPPAEDLNTFIQRSYVDTVDVEVSPNTDLEGRYLVFVEMDRNPTFPNKFKSLLRDVENVTGDIDWEIKTYLSNGQSFASDDPELFNYLIVDPAAYVTKDKFMKESVENGLREFLKDSYVSHLQVNESTITLTSGNKVVTAELVDVGEYDQVVRRNLLSESAFRLGSRTTEAATLGSMLADCEITPIDSFICVSKRAGNSIMLLRNLELKY